MIVNVYYCDKCRTVSDHPVLYSMSPREHMGCGGNLTYVDSYEKDLKK